MCDPAWQRASSSVTTKGFDAAYDDLIHAQTPFTSAWHTHEVADVKKQFSAEAILAGCQSYQQLFGAKVSALESETKKLSKMHLAQRG